MSSALQPLAAFQAPGWEFEYVPSECGYFVHRGYVYLTGAIVATPESTQTIYTGMPAGIAPSKPHALTLIVHPEQTDDPANPALELPTSYAATIHPDGKLTLDNALPKQVLTAPTIGERFYWVPEGAKPSSYEAVPQYTEPLRLGMVLGNLRWPLPSGAIFDTYTPLSMAAFLAEGFEDIDLTYAIHGSRVHLDGRVRVLTDGAQILFEGGAIGPHGDDLGLRAPFRQDIANFGGRSAEVGPNGFFPATGGAILIFNEDLPLVPATDDAPISACSPYFGNPEPFNRNFINLPPNETEAKERREKGERYTGLGQILQHIHYDNGKWICELEVTGGPEPPFPEHLAYECPKGGPLPAPFAFTLAELLAMCDPTPDWFWVRLDMTGQSGFANEGCGPAHLALPLPEKPFCQNNFKAGSRVVTTGAILLNSKGEPEEGKVPAAEDPPTVSGYLAPPEGLFKGNPWRGWKKPEEAAHPSKRLLWTPAAAAGVAITTGYELLPGNQVNEGVVSFTVSIGPFYSRRQIGCHAGDVLDLTGSGWYGDEAGVIAVGPSTKGSVKRPQLKLPPGRAN